MKRFYTALLLAALPVALLQAQIITPLSTSEILGTPKTFT